MPRPKKVLDSMQLNLRLSRDAVARADKLIDHVGESLGLSATRADVLRAALMTGLRQLELEKAASRARRRTT